MMRPSYGNWPILLIATGFTAWAAVFLLLYGAQAVGCRLAWDRIDLFGVLSIQRFIQIALYLGGLLGLVLLWWWLRRRPVSPAPDSPPGSFLIQVSRHAALAALGAVAFCFAGVFWLMAC
jgi:hypothetical protein